ncbi:Zn-dependent hydrolase [Thalassobacillus devorans]|uniref:Zn-dependent hydrolase n=1 Tax=Thalassobacillus devorans TaxID=279813 RepID=UPI000A1CB068|nr:Zn-dependent hydrolase [Thalassobacillus devorans]
MVSLHRLKERMEKMNAIGKTLGGGVSRLALTREDMEARQLLVHWMEELGLSVRVDDFGNIYGMLAGVEEDSIIMLGSHLDTVPNGGKFDGTLGVLAAVEVIESLIEQGTTCRKSIMIVSFTNEEGARFTPQMLGSGAVTGKFAKEYVYQRKDNKGKTFKEALDAIGFMGEEKHRAKNLDAFVELHIEQGPILGSEQKSIGVVEGVAGFSWLEVCIEGEADHAGSTPMSMRKDSLVTASSIIKKLNDWGRSRDQLTVVTVGDIQTKPGIINAIPGSTLFTIDFRHPNKGDLYEGLDEIKQLIQEEVTANHLTLTLNEIRTQPPVAFSPLIGSIMEAHCRELDIPYRRMSSGAGHDAMYMQESTETGMLFVPSINGKSHCEEEETFWEDIEHGINVLFHVIHKLANAH